MSYLKYYKEFGPSWLNTSLLDCIKLMDKTKTKKYIPIFVKMFSERLNTMTSNDYQYINDELRDFISFEDLNNISLADKLVMYRFFSNMDNHTHRLIKSFIDYNERNMFPGLDINQVNTLESLTAYVHKADFSLAEKKFKKQVKKVLDTEKWLVLRPITWEASVQYGMSTRWCTSSKNDSHYFYKYASNGALYYIFDKKDRKKFAFYLPFDKDDNPGFFDDQDRRIDSILLPFTQEIINFFKNEMTGKVVSNRELDVETFDESMLNSHKICEVEPVSIDYPIHEPLLLERVVTQVEL